MRLSDLDDPQPPTPPADLPARLRTAQRARRQRNALVLLAACALGVAVLPRLGADGDDHTGDVAAASSTSSVTTGRPTSSSIATADGSHRITVAWVPEGFVPAKSLRTGGTYDEDLVRGWLSGDRGHLLVTLVPRTSAPSLTTTRTVTGATGRIYTIGVDEVGKRRIQWVVSDDAVIVVVAAQLDDDELVAVLDATALEPLP